jgi:hypothetical protein
MRILVVFLALFTFSSFIYKISSDYDVSDFYVGIVPEDSDTKVLSKNGDVEDVEFILVPTKMETGKFIVKLTKQATDLYQIDGTKYFLKTRYCYEYATSEEVVLIIESNYGYSKGKIIFD